MLSRTYHLVNGRTCTDDHCPVCHDDSDDRGARDNGFIFDLYAGEPLRLSVIGALYPYDVFAHLDT